MCGMWVLVLMGHLSLTLLTSLVLFVKKNHPHHHLPAVSSVPKTQKRITHQFLHATHKTLWHAQRADFYMHWTCFVLVHHMHMMTTLLLLNKRGKGMRGWGDQNTKKNERKLYCTHTFDPHPKKNCSSGTLFLWSPLSCLLLLLVCLCLTIFLCSCSSTNTTIITHSSTCKNPLRTAQIWTCDLW